MVGEAYVVAAAAASVAAAHYFPPSVSCCARAAAGGAAAGAAVGALFGGMIGYNSPDVGRVKIARPAGVFGATEGAVGGAAAVLALYLGGALADAALAAAWARFCAAVHAAAD